MDTLISTFVLLLAPFHPINIFWSSWTIASQLPNLCQKLWPQIIAFTDRLDTPLYTRRRLELLTALRS